MFNMPGHSHYYEYRTPSSTSNNGPPQQLVHGSFNVATTSTDLMPQQTLHSIPFVFNQYAGTNINVLIPTPNLTSTNYVQQQALTQHAHPQPRESREPGYYQDRSQRRVKELPCPNQHKSQTQSRSPPIKSESVWISPQVPQYAASDTSNNTALNASANGSQATEPNEANFATEVDTLMRAIQAKTRVTTLQTPALKDKRQPVMNEDPPHDGKKRFCCTVEGCSKAFNQKTHLLLHERSHTGYKPYKCKAAGCTREFSQRGNLKTHERRHTGEKPYKCDLCDKYFAQRGNVRAHRITHGQAKPYSCRLDDCGKLFTQLGNLKSHQNKFHAPTLRLWTERFASMDPEDLHNQADRDMYEYFANLYKHSNQGIKGRGKDRKVESTPQPNMSAAGIRNWDVDARGYQVAASESGMVVSNPGSSSTNQRGLRQDVQHYDMLDADDESQTGSYFGSRAASSAASSFDEGPAETYGNSRQSNHLAFGDRMY